MRRIWRLEGSFDEFISIDRKIIDTLSAEQKEHIKARLEAVGEKLEEVVRKM